MNLEKEGFTAKEQPPEFDADFGEIDFQTSDTVKDVLPETLRSVDEDVIAESGVREKNPNGFVVRGTVPESTNFPQEVDRDKKDGAVLGVKSAGFRVKKIPEWEMGVRGTIKIDAMDELPPIAESIIEKNEEEEQKAA